MVCGRCWLVLKNTYIFIRLSYYSRVDNAFQLEVCFSVYILISACNTFLSWRAGIFFIFAQNMPKNVNDIYFMQWTWNYQLSWSWSCPIQKIYVLSRTHKKQTNVGVAFIRITRFHYRNINHVYQLNYCLSYFGLYFSYQRLISTW